MATVDFTHDAVADVRGLGLGLDQQVALVATILGELSYLPSRHPPCISAGQAARRLVTGPFRVVYDSVAPAGAEQVTVLAVLPAKGHAAALTVQQP